MPDGRPAEPGTWPPASDAGQTAPGAWPAAPDAGTVAGVAAGLVAGVAAGFARTLRAAGVAADHHREQSFLRALAHLDVACERDVYWAGRVTMCAGPDDLSRYDRCFAAFFGGRRPPPARPAMTVTVTRTVALPYDPREPETGGEQSALPATASEVEVLRHRDVAHLTEAERREIHRMLALLRDERERRSSRRFRPSHRGDLDGRRTVREAARRGGDVARLRLRAHRDRPRRVVVVVDVSGSMAPYADTLLRFAHALMRAEPGATEVFSAGTRLTRITAELRRRDPDAAMRACSSAIPDWSGGTRLGEELKALLRLPHPRGATVVIASDGWERGSADLLGAQMARLSRIAHRVIWVNPHKGDPAYRPLTAGMRAALPYVTDFVAGHSLAAFENLAALLAGRSVRTEREVAADA